MKEDIIEYHPNGSIKHRISYYEQYEQYYDQHGSEHREQGLPDYHSWYENGRICHITYCVHGKKHNIHNSSDIYFFRNGKIRRKYYKLNDRIYSKLIWMNRIKNI